MTEKIIIATANIFQSISSPLFTPEAERIHFSTGSMTGERNVRSPVYTFAMNPPTGTIRAARTTKKMISWIQSVILRPKMSDEETSCTSGRWRYGDAMCTQVIQREVEFQDVDPGFTEETELLVVRSAVQQAPPHRSRSGSARGRCGRPGNSLQRR